MDEHMKYGIYSAILQSTCPYGQVNAILHFPRPYGRGLCHKAESWQILGHMEEASAIWTSICQASAKITYFNSNLTKKSYLSRKIGGTR